MSKEYHIPFDIQIEIMKRLPIESLIKFRSVSKPWKSIINSSKFIADYNNNHTHHCNPQQLLVGFSDDDYVDYVYILDDDDDNNSFPLLNCSVPVPSSIKPSSYNLISSIGYSQGLFGFYYYDRYPSVAFVVIWNPSIRKSVVIPIPNNVFKRSYDTVFGFGVCNASDPMIVKMNLIDSDDVYDATSSMTWQVEVFTLSTGVWRTLSNAPPRESLFLTTKVVVIDKFIYWLAVDEVDEDDDDDDDYTLILSFDVTTEEFKEIYLPPILAHTFYDYLELSKLKESLVVLHIIKLENACKYDVWMREDGVQNSFRKLYTVKPPDASTQSVLGFRNNGLLIIQRRDNDEARFFVYEPDIGLFNDIGISGIYDSFLAGSYMGTLLLLDH